MSGSGKGNVPTLGGWIVTALLAVGVFLLLRNALGFFPLSAACFGLAAGLLLLLLLMSSGASEPEVESRVRRIVPTPSVPEAPVVAPNRVQAAPAPASVVQPEPVAAPVDAEPTATSAGPLRLAEPRGGKADDLKSLEGIGPALEKLLNSLGFYHFDQIAGWSEADVALLDAEMKTFKGRIVRDRWVAQAKIIVNEGLEAFRERAKSNDY